MDLGLYWTRELSVGVERIDQQHQELFAHVNRLLGACITNTSPADTTELLAFLQRYVAEHFREEEELMERSGYGAREMHRRQHRLFTRRLEHLAGRLLAKPYDERLLEELNEMVIDWLYEHVCMEDRSLGSFLGRA